MFWSCHFQVQIIVLLSDNIIETICCSFLYHVRYTLEHCFMILLNQWNDIRLANHPPTADSRCLKKLSCWVYVQNSLLQCLIVLWMNHFWQFFSLELIKHESFVYTVLNDYQVRNLQSHFAYSVNLTLSEYFACWILRTVDYDHFDFFSQFLFKSFPVYLPIFRLDIIVLKHFSYIWTGFLSYAKDTLSFEKSLTFWVLAWKIVA
jgi:hypothetical protein